MENLNKELRKSQDVRTDELGKRKAEEIEEKHKEPSQKKHESSENTDNTLQGYTNLSKDLIKYMFSFLKPTDIARMKQVSKSNNMIGEEVETDLLKVPFDNRLEEAYEKIKSLLASIFVDEDEIQDEIDDADYQWIHSIFEKISSFIQGGNDQQEIAELKDDIIGEILSNISDVYIDDTKEKFLHCSALEDMGNYFIKMGKILKATNDIIENLLDLAELYHHSPPNRATI